jgi:hypothetical protein
MRHNADNGSMVCPVLVTRDLLDWLIDDIRWVPEALAGKPLIWINVRRRPSRRLRGLQISSPDSVAARMARHLPPSQRARMTWHLLRMRLHFPLPAGRALQATFTAITMGPACVGASPIAASLE